MRFAGRLARLARLAALIPPPDPLHDRSEAELARARAIIAARSPIDPRDLHYAKIRNQPPPVRPPVSGEDAAWFLRTIAPLLPAYDAFTDAHRRWARRFRDKPRNADERLACIFPAFAGGRGWRLSLPLAIPDDLVAGLARVAGEGYEPAHSS